MPADPFEAELLMMAEAVAVAEKGSDDSSDESDTETSTFLFPPNLKFFSSRHVVLFFVAYTS